MGGLPSQGRDPGQSGGFAHVRRNPGDAGGHGAQPVLPRAAAFWVLSSAPSWGAWCPHHRRVRGPPSPTGPWPRSPWVQLGPVAACPCPRCAGSCPPLADVPPGHPEPLAPASPPGLGEGVHSPGELPPCAPGPTLPPRGEVARPPPDLPHHTEGSAPHRQRYSEDPPPCSPARGGQRPQMTAGGRPRLPCAQRRRGCCGATSATGPPGAGSRPGPACGARDLAAGR